MAYHRTSHAVYELNYHLVWPIKYRKHFDSLETRKFLEELFPKIALAYGFAILEQNIQKDHIHLFVSAPPRFSPARLAQILKSVSAKQLFKKFPKIHNELWGGEFWSRGYFVRGVGDKITSTIIQRYIKYQEQEALEVQQKLF